MSGTWATTLPLYCALHLRLQRVSVTDMKQQALQRGCVCTLCRPRFIPGGGGGGGGGGGSAYSILIRCINHTISNCSDQPLRTYAQYVTWSSSYATLYSYNSAYDRAAHYTHNTQQYRLLHMPHWMTQHSCLEQYNDRCIVIVARKHTTWKMSTYIKKIWHDIYNTLGRINLNIQTIYWQW